MIFEQSLRQIKWSQLEISQMYLQGVRETLDCLRRRPMFDLCSAFDNFTSDIDVNEPQIDRDFITNFLAPYFSGLPREQLAAKVAEVISSEQARHAIGHRPR